LIHNNRFQIDTLALQALLYDTRSEESAGVELLSRALDLAEPGGFIRLLVDLGLQMAGLLKRLIEKNVAVKKHLTSIYGKLNVTGRLQAIEKADALGIFTRR